MAQVPTGWWNVETALRTHAESASLSSLGTPGPGESSGPHCDRSNGFAACEATCLGYRIDHAFEVLRLAQVGEVDLRWVTQACQKPDGPSHTISVPSVPPRSRTRRHLHIGPVRTRTARQGRAANRPVRSGPQPQNGTTDGPGSDWGRGRVESEGRWRSMGGRRDSIRPRTGRLIMPERARIIGLAYVRPRAPHGTASSRVPSRSRTPVARVPEHSTCAAMVSG